MSDVQDIPDGTLIWGDILDDGTFRPAGPVLFEAELPSSEVDAPEAPCPACLAPDQPSLFDASRLNEAYGRVTTDIFARAAE